jgi:hypothetical protein
MSLSLSTLSLPYFGSLTMLKFKFWQNRLNKFSNLRFRSELSGKLVKAISRFDIHLYFGKLISVPPFKPNQIHSYALVLPVRVPVKKIECAGWRPARIEIGQGLVSHIIVTYRRGNKTRETGHSRFNQTRSEYACPGINHVNYVWLSCEMCVRYGTPPLRW